MRFAFTMVFGVLMVAAGAVHFASPATYTPFFPASFPALAIVYASGLAEIVVGVATLVPSTRRWGTLGILVLMVAYLPLHAIDLFLEHPVIGSHTVACVRFPMQLVLIGWAWLIYRGVAEPGSRLSRREA